MTTLTVLSLATPKAVLISLLGETVSAVVASDGDPGFDPLDDDIKAYQNLGDRFPLHDVLKG